jgi:hypothetical protein
VEFDHQLVGGFSFNHLENMKVNGNDYPIYYGNMFETTNQSKNWIDICDFKWKLVIMSS